MAHQTGPKARVERDRNRAAAMKRDRVVRTIGRCAVCYKLVTIDSWRSRYTHICR